MAQVTIYLPDELEKKVRREAKRARKSLSAYLAELAAGRRAPKKGWPEGFAALFGSWEGDFPQPEDALPGPVEQF